MISVLCAVQAVFLLWTTGPGAEKVVESTFGGVHLSATRAQIATAYPVLAAYFVLLSVRVGNLHARFKHECWLMSLVVEKFGGPTFYGIMRRYKEVCRTLPTHPGRKSESFFSRTSDNGYAIAQYALVIWLLVHSWLLAVPHYWAMTRMDGSRASGWAVLVGAGALTALAFVSSIAKWRLKRLKDRLLPLVQEKILNSPDLPLSPPCHSARQEALMREHHGIRAWGRAIASTLRAWRRKVVSVVRFRSASKPND